MDIADRLVGLLIGNYEVLRRIGAGGMGEVYLARQVTLDRSVAIKFISAKCSENQEYIERFIRESRSAAKLNHPNIVTVYDAAIHEDVFYFAMEYIEGQNLSEYLKNGRKFNELDVLRYGETIANALAYTHKEGIIHRDVKPSNLIVTAKGELKLMDLGLAKELSGTSDSITGLGVVVGTAQYMSPEQIRAEKDLDGRTDIYALGATLYHLATGQLPFSGKSAVEIMSKHLTEPLTPPKSINPGLTEECSNVIMKMMAKKREDRFQDMDAVSHELARIQEAFAAKYSAASKNKIQSEIHKPSASRIIKREDLFKGVQRTQVILESAFLSKVFLGGKDTRIIIVSREIITGPKRVAELLMMLSTVFPDMELILMTQKEMGHPSFFGNESAVLRISKHLKSFPIETLPWQKSTVIIDYGTSWDFKLDHVFTGFVRPPKIENVDRTKDRVKYHIVRESPKPPNLYEKLRLEYYQYSSLLKYAGLLLLAILLISAKPTREWVSGLMQKTFKSIETSAPTLSKDSLVFAEDSALIGRELICIDDVLAFDVDEPTRLVGNFMVHTKLQVQSQGTAPGMMLVFFRKPDGSIVRAQCSSTDLKRKTLLVSKS